MTPKKPPARQLLDLVTALQDLPAGRQYLAALCPSLSAVQAFLAEAVEGCGASLVLRRLDFNVWEIGREGDTRRARFDGAGLALAHAVFVGEPLMVASSPGAVREALRRAARWADGACPLLAEAIRAVRVYTGEDGQAWPMLDPGYRRVLVLR